MLLKKYLNRHEALVLHCPYDLFRFHNKLKFDICFGQATNINNLPALVAQDPVVCTRNTKKFMEECFRGEWEGHYARYAGPTLFNLKIFPQITSEQTGIWIGGAPPNLPSTKVENTSLSKLSSSGRPEDLVDRQKKKE
jgi:hypothetical protein